MNVVERNGYVVVEFPKKVDRQTYNLAQNAFKNLLEKEYRLFALDFKNIDHIFSLEISIVIRLHKLVTERGAQLFLVNVNENLVKVLGSVQVNQTVPTYKTLEEFEIDKVPAK